MMNLDRWLKSALLVGLALTLTACGGGGGGSSVVKPRIRFVNASPDSASLTYTVDGDTKATGIAYLGLAPNFIEETAFSYDLAVHEDGANPDLDAIVAQFANDKEYLICTVGLEFYGTEFLKRLRLVAPEIDLTAPNGNKARIYVLHAFNRSAGLDTPNIDLRNPGDNPQYKVENIAFGSIGTLTIDASNQDFVARRNDSESVYATKNFTFDSGGIYLGIVGGVEGQVGTQAPKIEFVRIN
jgi:hypothetical protein